MTSAPVARRALAAAIAISANIWLVADAAAEASFVPGVSPETPTGSAVDGLAIPVLVIAVAALGFIVLRRSTSSRVASAVLIGVLGFLIGGVFVLAGLFGDLSGRHQIFVVPLVVGIVIMAAALVAMVRAGRSRGTRGEGAPPPAG